MEDWLSQISPLVKYRQKQNNTTINARMRVYQYVNYGPSHNEWWESLCQIRLSIQSLNKVKYRMHYLFIVANCQYFKTCFHIRVRNFSGTSFPKHRIITSVAGRSQYFTTHMTREQKQFNQKTVDTGSDLYTIVPNTQTNYYMLTKSKNCLVTWKWQFVGELNWTSENKSTHSYLQVILHVPTVSTRCRNVC